MPARLGEFLDELTAATGRWLDGLGGQTKHGRWHWFLTMSFRTSGDPKTRPVENEFGEFRHSEVITDRFGRPEGLLPWGRHFSAPQWQPKAAVVDELFRWFTDCYLPSEVDQVVEFYKGHQFGLINRRLHLHAALSWPGCEEWRWKQAAEILRERCGVNRILPWQLGAGEYISRYVGREAAISEWDARVLAAQHGADSPQKGQYSIARRDLVVSRPASFRSSGDLRSRSGLRAQFDLSRNQLNRLHRALKKLPDAQRKTLEYVFFDGVSENDIQTVSGEPIANLISDALNAIRSEISQ